MTHYSPNAPVNWTPLSKLIKDSSPMISSAIIAFSLCSHESRSQHLCEYLVGDCAFLMFFPCRGVPRTYPELLPWIIALWCSPNCFPGSFSYVQDHSVLYSTECPGPRCFRYCNVIGQVYLPVRSSFSSRGASSVLLRLLCHRKSLPA